MRKPKLSPVIIFTLMFIAFTFGFMVGRKTCLPAITVSVPLSLLEEPTPAPETEPAATVPQMRVTFPIDINRADKEMFMELPGIGEVMAERIIAYRNKHGAFTSIEELLHVEGMGQKKLDKIWDLIMIGG